MVRHVELVNLNEMHGIAFSKLIDDLSIMWLYTVIIVVIIRILNYYYYCSERKSLPTYFKYNVMILFYVSAGISQ